jgi:hypothetical protein
VADYAKLCKFITSVVLGKEIRKTTMLELNVSEIRRAQPGTGREGPEAEYSYSSTLSLTLALHGGGWSPHASATLPPGKRHDTHCIGGWVSPRADLDGC